jgi:hypothetical protein
MGNVLIKSDHEADSNVFGTPAHMHARQDLGQMVRLDPSFVSQALHTHASDKAVSNRVK